MSSIIIIGKIISLINQIIRSGNSSALPGLIALKLDSFFIKKFSQKNKITSIIITGTNGKTTTSRLIGDILKLQGIKFIHNRSGSNLLRGIASTLINQSNWIGQLKVNWAIWEVDEAAVKEAIIQLLPKAILFNNLSRDQLDRYGEVDAILKIWQIAINHLPKNSEVFINQTDKRLITLKAKNIQFFGSKSLPKNYQQLNFSAAMAIAQFLKIDSKKINQAIADFQPAFGRGETINYQGNPLKIYLVKNPAGFNSVWQMLHHTQNLNQPLLIALNDKIADGTDVSWIWDINFNYLNARKSKIIVSGTRGLDMAVRLKYAGLNPKLTIIAPKLTTALNYKPSIILPTYTAMLELRQIILNQKFD